MKKQYLMAVGRPFLATLGMVGLVAFVITLYLCVVVLPWGNDAIVQHRWRLINTRTIAGVMTHGHAPG